MTNLKEMLIKAIEKDEREYCFDRNYYSDEEWKEENGEETREDAFVKATSRFPKMTTEEILVYFGDRYDHVLKSFKMQQGKEVNGFQTKVERRQHFIDFGNDFSVDEKRKERVRPTKEQWMAIELDEQIPEAYESLGKLSDILGDDFLEKHDLSYRIWAWENKGDLMLTVDGGNTHCGVIAYMYGDSITIIQSEFSDDAIDAALVKAISTIKLNMTKTKVNIYKHNHYKCLNCKHTQVNTEFGECAECGYEDLVEITEEEYVKQATS